LRAHAIHPPQQHSEHEQHDRLDRQVAERRLRRVPQQHAGDCRRDRRDEDLEPGLARLVRDGRIGRERVAEQLDPRRSERHDEREQRAPVERDVEADAGYGQPMSLGTT
jgi:hypothetical protein